MGAGPTLPWICCPERRHGAGNWARMVQGQDVDWSAVPQVPEGEWGRTFRAGGAELVRAMEQLPEDRRG